MKLINGGLKTKSSDEIINISRKQQLATLIIKWSQIKSERKFAKLSPKKLKNNINNNIKNPLKLKWTREFGGYVANGNLAVCPPKMDHKGKGEGRLRICRGRRKFNLKE